LEGIKVKILCRLLPIIAMLALCTSCAEFLQNRTFVDQMDRESDGLFVPGEDFPVLAGDTGHAYRSRDQVMGRTPASAGSYQDSLRNRSLFQELRKKESLLTAWEQQEYQEASSYLDTVSERIYYLGLSPEERTEYIGGAVQKRYQRKKEFDDYRTKRRATLSYHDTLNVKDREIYQGMSKDSVIDLWGRPSSVEVAGSPGSGNERWSFYNKGQRNVIYFEGGKVNGWSLN